MASATIDMDAVSAAAKLLRGMGATRVFIFGSAVKGGLRPDSDVDMAVTGTTCKARGIDRSLR